VSVMCGCVCVCVCCLCAVFGRVVLVFACIFLMCEA